MPQKTPSGFTLIELAAAVAVLAIVLTMGVPYFLDMLRQQRLKSAAETIASDLQLARSEALKRNTRVTLSFVNGADGHWCYGLTDANGCDCYDQCQVQGDDARIVQGDGFRGVTLQTTFPGGNASFNPERGALQAGGVNLRTETNKGAAEVRVLVNTFGRVRLCSGDVAGYGAC